MEPNTKLLVSAKEISERLGMSIRHIRRMHSAGKLPKAIRIGRLVRWSEFEIEQWVAQGCPAKEEQC